VLGEPKYWSAICCRVGDVDADGGGFDAAREGHHG
jgi:hypothetical protein